MTTPASTIVVIGREAFSPTPEMLLRLRRHTRDPLRVVVVDGGSPTPIRQRLEALAREHDFTLIRRDALVTANESRNLGLKHVDTEFVVFIDNDTLVDAGWLEGLERCARETGAGAVSPVVLWGPTWREEIHFAGGTCHIASESGAGRLVDHNARMHLPSEAVAGLSREPTELTELHCILVRVEALESTAPFDESLVAGREEAHLSLAFAAASTTIWLEPSVVVGYPAPKRLRRYDQSYFRARWSDAWADRAFDAFNAMWRLDDTEIDNIFKRGHMVRRIGPWPATTPGWRNRVDQLAWKRRRAVDVVATPLAARAQDRRRAKAPPPRVVHRASWDVAAGVGVGDHVDVADRRLDDRPLG